MESFGITYAKQVHKYFQTFYANWFPDNPVMLGDIGTLTKNVLFERKDNIKDRFGLTIKKRPAIIKLPVKGEASNHYQINTGNGASAKLIAKGTSNLVHGGVEVTFQDTNSFFFNLAGVIIQEISDQLWLSDQIINLYQQGQWKKEWCIITSLLYSSSTIILGSKAGSKTAVLEAQNDIPVIDLTSTNIQFALKNNQMLDYKMISQNSVAPLFKLSRLRYKLFNGLGLGMTEDDISLDEIRDMALSDGEDLKNMLELKEVQE